MLYDSGGRDIVWLEWVWRKWENFGWTHAWDRKYFMEQYD